MTATFTPTTEQLSLLQSLQPHLSEQEKQRLAELLKPQPTPSQQFRSRLLISAGGKDVPFQSVLEPWQAKDFEALDPGWEMVAGLKQDAPFRRAYLERARGHSKTTDMACMVLFALASSQTMISGVAAAADQQQARLIRDATARCLSLNPWLHETIDVQNYRVRNRVTGSVLDVISNDAGSSYGITPDFIIVDELTHWKKPDLWDSLFSSAAKRPKCMLVIITNAGMGQGISWQWQLRESCRTDEQNWYFSRLDGPQASWITAKSLEEQKKHCSSPLVYQRLWLNQWVRETGEGLEWADIEAAMTLPGPQPFNADLIYLGCLDIGIRNDHSAFVVLALDVPNERFKVVNVRSWKPKDYGGQVQIAEVKQDVLDLHREYKFRMLVYDAWNAVDIVQELSKQAAHMSGLKQCPPLNLCEFRFQAQGQLEMAEALLQVFRNRQIDLYDHKDLIDDLMRIQIEDKGIGYKVTAKRDDLGHADRGIALAMGLAEGMKGMKLLREPYVDDGLGDSLI